MISLIKPLIGIVVLTLFFSCSSNDKTVLLPNGESIGLSNIESLNNKYGLEYKQYDGFYIEYEDSVLGDLHIRFEDDLKAVGSDVLSEDDIKKLYDRKVESVSFGKIPVSKISPDELKEFLLSKYENAISEEVKKKGNDREILIVNSNTGEKICIIRYVEFGVPGCFVDFA